VLVSGTGDGGLIDVLRYSFSDFRHEEVLDRLKEEWLHEADFDDIKQQLEAIEVRALYDNTAGVPYEARLNSAYRRLGDSIALKAPISLRKDVVVILTGMSPFPLTLESAPINRFLFSLTNTQYVRGPLSFARKGERDWTARFCNELEDRRFEDVVIRHGPTLALKKYFPEIYSKCGSLIEQARHAGNDPTRTPRYDATFAEAIATSSDVQRVAFMHTEPRRLRVELNDESTPDADEQALEPLRGVLLRVLPDAEETFDPDRVELTRRNPSATDIDVEPVSWRVSAIDAHWLMGSAPIRIICGPAGVGKSMLLRYFARLGANAKTLLPLFVPALRVTHSAQTSIFIASIDWVLDSLAVPDGEKPALRSGIVNSVMQGGVAVFLDDFDALPPDVSAEIIDIIKGDDINFARGNRLILSSRTSLDHAEVDAERFDMQFKTSQYLMRLARTTETWPPAARDSFLSFAAFASRLRLTIPNQPEPMMDQDDVPSGTLGTLHWLYWWAAKQFGRQEGSIRVALGDLALQTLLNARTYFNDGDIAETLEAMQGFASLKPVIGDVKASVLLKEAASGESMFAHPLVHQILAGEALARSGDFAKAVALALEEQSETLEAYPIALALMQQQTPVLERIQSLPESVDLRVVRLRARTMRYLSHFSVEQASDLANAVFDIVCDLNIASMEVVMRVADDCLGIAPGHAVAIEFRLSVALDRDDPFITIRVLAFLEHARTPGATRLVIPQLRSVSDDVRKAAASTLGQLGDQAAIPSLIEAFLSGGRAFVFSEAAEAVAAIGGEAAEHALADILDNGEIYQNFRWPTAEALGRFGGQRALESLIRATGDLADVVRQHAAQALRRYSDPQAVAAMIRCAEDSDFSVRIAAMTSLSFSVANVSASVFEKGLHDSHNLVRTLAAGALMARDRATLLTVVKDVIARPQDTWRVQALDFYRRILGENSLPALLRLSRESAEDLRLGAAKALRHLTATDALDRLLEMADDPSEDVRYAVVEHLSSRVTPAFAPALARRLEADEGTAVVAVAVAGLAKTHDPVSIEALTKAVERRAFASTFAAVPLALVAGSTSLSVLVSAWHKTPHPVSLERRTPFAVAIGRIDDEAAASELRRLMLTEEESGRIDLIHGLRAMSHPAAVPGLLESLDDKSETVRQHSRWTLQEMPLDQVSAGLKLALGDEQHGVRRHAAMLCPFYADAEMIQALEHVNPETWGSPDSNDLVRKAQDAAALRLSLTQEV